MWLSAALSVDLMPAAGIGFAAHTFYTVHSLWAPFVKQLIWATCCLARRCCRTGCQFGVGIWNGLERASPLSHLVNLVPVDLEVYKTSVLIAALLFGAVTEVSLGQYHSDTARALGRIAPGAVERSECCSAKGLLAFLPPFSVFLM